MLGNIMAHQETVKPTASFVEPLFFDELEEMTSDIGITQALSAIEIGDNVISTLETAASFCDNARVNKDYNGKALAQMVTIAASQAKLIGLKLEGPAGESFDTDYTESVRLAGEGLKDNVTKAYDKSKQFLQYLIKVAKDFFKKHFSKLGRLDKAIPKAQEKFASIHGEPKEDQVNFKTNLLKFEGKHQSIGQLEVNVRACEDLVQSLRAANISLAKDREIKFTIAGKVGNPSPAVLKKIGVKKDRALEESLQLVGDMEAVIYEDKAKEGEEQENIMTVVAIMESDKYKGKDKKANVLYHEDVLIYLRNAAAYVESAKRTIEAGEAIVKTLDIKVGELKKTAKSADKDDAKEFKAQIKSLKKTAKVYIDFAKSLSIYCSSQAAAVYKFAVLSGNQYTSIEEVDHESNSAATGLPAPAV